MNNINIFSKSESALGRWMSNFTRQPIETVDGHFESVEGYWYWLGKRDDRLRTLSGFAAKQLGRSLPEQVRLPEEEFRARIEAALRLKLAANQAMRQQFVESSAPFEHYYEYGGRRIDAGFAWLVELWEKLRTELKARQPVVVSVRGLQPNTPGITYVGRKSGGWQQSPLHNPFRMNGESQRDEVIAEFRDHLWEIVCSGMRAKGLTAEERAAWDELVRLTNLYAHGENITLGCWCHPKACHAEVVKRAIIWLAKELYHYDT